MKLSLEKNRMVAVPNPRLPELQGYDKSFPVCGDIARRLLSRFPGMIIDPALRERFQILAYEQREVARSVLQRGRLSTERLRPYQVGGSQWLHAVKRGILADAPGLGKTVMSIAAGNLAGPRSSLVICHKKKISDWKRHIEEWSDFPELWEVTNFAQLSIRPFSPKLIIIDEAHKLRNRKTAVFKTCRKVAKDAEYAFLLTGSPSINVSSDIWTLLAICDSPRFASYWGFAFRFLEITNSGMGMEVGGVRVEERANLQKLISPYLLRREDQLELPTPVWREVIYTQRGDQSRLYECMMEGNEATYAGESVEALLQLSKITRLRQLSLHPGLIFRDYTGPSKLDALDVLLNEFDGQVVVFSMYAKLIQLVRKKYPGQCVIIVGGMTQVQSDTNIDDFKSGRVRMIAMTYNSGGEGLDLQEAEKVIMLDYPWHKAGLDQATRRVLRYGCKHESVEFITVHAKGTIDDHIKEILRKKGKVTIQEILKEVEDQDEIKL